MHHHETLEHFLNRVEQLETQHDFLTPLVFRDSDDLENPHSFWRGKAFPL